MLHVPSSVYLPTHKFKSHHVFCNQKISLTVIIVRSLLLRQNTNWLCKDSQLSGIKHRIELKMSYASAASRGPKQSPEEVCNFPVPQH